MSTFLGGSNMKKTWRRASVTAGVGALLAVSAGTAPTLAATGSPPPTVGIARGAVAGQGWLADAAGGVTSIGGAPEYGSTAGTALKSPIVGITPTESGRGYWLVGHDGGVFSFGDASFH